LFCLSAISEAQVLFMQLTLYVDLLSMSPATDRASVPRPKKASESPVNSSLTQCHTSQECLRFTDHCPGRGRVSKSWTFGSTSTFPVASECFDRRPYMRKSALNAMEANSVSYLLRRWGNPHPFPNQATLCCCVSVSLLAPIRLCVSAEPLKMHSA
jgi:hypothetical protein